VCGGRQKLESITVRLYRKRSQAQYNYFICRECTDILTAFLEGGSISKSSGLFDPPAERRAS